MTRQYLVILTKDGTIELESIDFGTGIPGTAGDVIEVQVFNPAISGPATNATLNACRADMLINGPAGEEDEVARENGSEIASESWIEARIPPSLVWVPLDEYANALSIGSIAAQAHVDVEMRLNTPSDALTFGDAGFCLVARCDP